MASVETLASPTSIRSLPTACTASAWNGTPRRAHSAASSRTGCPAPAPVLAHLPAPTGVPRRRAGGVAPPPPPARGGELAHGRRGAGLVVGPHHGRQGRLRAKGAGELVHVDQ